MKLLFRSRPGGLKGTKDQGEKRLFRLKKPHSHARERRTPDSQAGSRGKTRGKSIKKTPKHTDIKIRCKKMHCTCLYLLQIIQNIRQTPAWMNAEWLHSTIPHAIRTIIESRYSRIKFITFLLHRF